MQGNIGAAPGIRCRRQVIGVGFASDFEHRELQALGHFRARSKPLGIGPALNHRFRKRIAFLRFFLHIMKLIKHEQSFLEALCCYRSHFRIVQQINQGSQVVPAQHSAQQLGGFSAADQGANLGAVGDSGQVAGFNLGCVVHTSRHAVRDQVEQKGCLTLGWFF